MYLFIYVYVTIKDNILHTRSLTSKKEKEIKGTASSKTLLIPVYAVRPPLRSRHHHVSMYTQLLTEHRIG